MGLIPEYNQTGAGGGGGMSNLTVKVLLPLVLTFPTVDPFV